MKVLELLEVAGISVSVKCGEYYVENVSTDNDLIAPYVFHSKIENITASQDDYGNFVLEVEIE